MATSTVMQVQSIMASPLTLVSQGSSANSFSPAHCVKRPRKMSSLRVRATAEEDKKEIASESTSPLATPPLPKTVSKPKVSTKFTDVLAFGGPGPERINGRLAMIGFVSAMAVELANGQDVFAQLANGGVSLFLGTSILLSVASLIPLFKGVTVESKSEGIMSSSAEMWNGRLAMLGLVALAVTEYVKGGALV